MTGAPARRPRRGYDPAVLRERLGLTSIVVAAAEVWSSHTLIDHSSPFNRTMVRPLFMLASIGWLLGIAAGIGALRLGSRDSRIAGAAGLAGSLAGLALLWWKYFHWWVK